VRVEGGREDEWRRQIEGGGEEKEGKVKEEAEVNEKKEINGSHLLDGRSMSKFWQMRHSGKEGGTLGGWRTAGE
jgi:hypothetical protein